MTRTPSLLPVLAEAGVVTFANLQSGLEHALGAVHHRIVEVVPEDAG